jgi:tRNA (guanine10-N2)-dimethyltransferase
MTTYLFELHKQKPIATAEVKSILLNIDPNANFEEKEDFLFVIITKDIPDLTKKLAYTHNIYEHICDYSDESLKKADWKKFYKNNFAIRSIDKEIIDKVSKAIWEAVDDPKVKLNNSNTELYFFFNQVFVIKQRISTQTLKRSNQNRPVKNPVSLSPLLALAMVNLTKGTTVYDPFCGTGGILLEAALLNRKIIGSDISYQMIKGTEINLKHFGINDFNLFRADATKHKLDDDKKTDAIICDPPYGQSSRLYGTKSKDLYIGFLKNLPNLLKQDGELIIIFPNYMDYKKILSDSGLKIKEEFEEYIHLHLTRIIVHIILK